MEIDKPAREFKEFKLMNGALMNKSLNKPARIFIKVQETQAGGKKIQGATTDKLSITVELDEPLDQPLQSWIEVLGVPKSVNVLKGEEIYCFEQNENNEPFDEDSHNEIIELINNISEEDLYKFK